MAKVLGLLGGNDMPPRQIAEWARSADVVLAADGAANILHSMDIVPTAVIGDFDSVDSEARSFAQDAHFDPDQDTSDCDKLLRWAAAKGHADITLCNIEGDQLDHVLGNVQSAARSSLRVRLALRRGMGYVVKAGELWSLDCEIGTRVSLLPLENCRGVQLSGTRWPLTGQSLEARGLTSLSNLAEADRISVHLDEGSAVLFLATDRREVITW
jgi:thiamine pyrophosphokinase